MKIVVTGGYGFLGSAVTRELRGRDHEVVRFRSRDWDLRDREITRYLLSAEKPDAVVHLAAAVGGVGDNVAHPGKFVYENAVMGLELMEAARKCGVQKYLTVGTACMYPADAFIPTHESELWDGEPPRDTGAYGHAKRLLLVQSQAYRDEYDLDAVFVIPSNLYGPDDYTTHVIPSLIRKFSEDGRVMVWGDPWTTRDFLFVEDAARGIAQALEFYSSPEPVNLGSGVETSILEVVSMLSAIYSARGRRPAIRWDSSKPRGAERRLLDTTRAASELGWHAETGLSAGLHKTVDWYEGRHVV